MKALIGFFLKRPLLVNILTIIIFLVGAGSLYFLQKETFPKIEFDFIVVRTNYPGSSSDDVEKLVTIPIERSLKGVDGIKNMNAVSGEGFSIITLEIEPDDDLVEVYNEIKDAVESTTDLAEEADTPIVRKINNKERGTIKVALTGQEYKNLREVSKILRDRLEQMSNMSRVNLSGYRIDEIRIELDQKKLADFELTIGEVTRVIKERNINLSAGYLESPKGDILIRTMAEFINVKEIQELTIRSNPSGKRVKIKDIAKVERLPEEDSIIERSNGERAIFLDCLIKNKADVIKTTRRIKKLVEQFFEGKDIKVKYPSIKYRFTDDFSYYVARRLNILTTNGIQGIILVFFALLIFLNFTTSVVTSIGAPLAFACSFIVMELTGISINLISMFGLIIVLGMLVDDSIIVSEQYYQNVEAGLSKSEAAKKAAIETVRPIIATVITTIIAFGSLFFMGGIMGKFLYTIPCVVIICLLASVFECFFILPSHLKDFARIPKKSGDSSRWYTPIIKAYGVLLKKLLKFPFIISFLFTGLFVGTLFLAKSMPFELFPGDDVRLVFLQVKSDVGTTLQKTDQKLSVLEKMIFEEVKPGEMDQIRSKTGKFMDERSTKTGPHYGTILIYLTPPDERKRTTDEIVKNLIEKGKHLVKGSTLTVLKRQGGPPKGKPVEVEITGDKLEELKLLAHKVNDLLGKTSGVLSTEIDFEEGKTQIIANIDDGESRRLGISTASIAMELRRAFSGDSITEIRESDEDIPIRVYLDKKGRSNLKTLSSLYIKNPMGNRIPLTKVVKFSERPGAFAIRRKNRKRIISVSGTLNKKITNPVQISRELTPKLEKIFRPYPHLRFSFGGENEDTKESMRGLMKAGIIAFLCIFFVLVVMFNSLFQPLVIMSAIPMGLVGVVLAFKIKGASLSFMALLGVIGLVGVVVNDSIVLVNFINIKREELDNDFQAIIEACRNRFRPVILTTLTTVVGLLPVAHAGIFGGSSGDPFIKPMAFAFAYGLTFATFITLFFIPANYLCSLKIYNFFMFLWRKIQKRPRTEKQILNG